MACCGSQSLDNHSLGNYYATRTLHREGRGTSPQGGIREDSSLGDIYDLATYQPSRSIGALVSRVRVEWLAALDRELAADKRLAALEMSAAQYIVIASLAGPAEPKSAADLCKGLSYDAGAMTRMLDRLEAKGLIRRSRSVQDRRLMELELTEEGRDAYPRMREISMLVANRLLRNFTKSEARQLEGFLSRMLENAQSAQAAH
jgi:DNA-binding MarR family transcriptional regulator